jgi:hypothetical protein
MLQRANRGSIVATQSLARALGTSVFFEDVGEVAELLRDEDEVAPVRASVMRARRQFTFDAHADRLVEFFRSTIERRAGRLVPGGDEARRRGPVRGLPPAGVPPARAP